jgi:hypothetical protein
MRNIKYLRQEAVVKNFSFPLMIKAIFKTAEA